MTNSSTVNRYYQNWLPLLLLAVSSISVYLPALGHDFLINWDDLQYVTDNPTVQGFSAQHLKEAFTTLYLGNYSPLHIISYMFDFQIWGMRASGFILTNILLHTANGVLVYLLFKKHAEHYIWPFCAALIFLLHPVQVESVVWISQRKNVLAMFFFLTSFHAYLQYRTLGDLHRRWYYLLSLSAFSLSLLSKSVAVILPAALLLHDICYLKQQNFKQSLFDKAPYLLISLIFSIIAVYSHSAQTLGGGTSYHGGSPYATFLTMLPVVLTYLRMIIWPSGLSAFYDPPIRTALDFQVVAAAIICVLLAIIGYYLFRRFRELFFWYALFFIGLLPVMQIIPIVTLINDRYLYFPMLGAAPLLSILVMGSTTWQNLTAKNNTKVRAAACLLALIALTAATVFRVPIWSSSYTLWKDAMTKSPNVPLVHDCFGESLLERGQLDEAMQQFRIALQLRPSATGPNLSLEMRNALANTYNNLGTTFGIKGLPEDAIRNFETAVNLDPGFHKAHFNLGNALALSGRLEQALVSFEQAVRLNPANRTYRANLEMTRRLISNSSSTIPSAR